MDKVIKIKGLPKKEYYKQYYLKNREEILRKTAIYHKKYHKKNKDNRNKYSREYRLKNKEEIKMKKQTPEYKQRQVKLARIYKKNNPEKIKAQNYAMHHNQRQYHCALCTLFKNLNNQYGIYVEPFLGDETNLHFHHTDYIQNEGITLCKKHHTEEHMSLNEVGT